MGLEDSFSGGGGTQMHFFSPCSVFSQKMRFLCFFFRAIFGFMLENFLSMKKSSLWPQFPPEAKNHPFRIFPVNKVVFLYAKLKIFTAKPIIFLSS